MLELDELFHQAQSAIQASNDLKTLDACRVKFLGKKGLLTDILKSVGQLPSHERPAAGQKVNEIKNEIESLIAQKNDILKQSLISEELNKQKIDITLPGRNSEKGSLHPISHTINSLRYIFLQMGFSFMEGPEVEEDHYNFTALNIPPLHPARAMQDTFYFADGLLLRSQMSPVQIHAMKKFKPPLKMVAIGRVYRRDFDLTHTPMFHQMECLLVDEKVTFANLKGLIQQFLSLFFECDANIRFRPSYFPFTEPSAEVDMSCLNCSGSGCRVCKQSGWLEILGCGMVHPNVLRGVNIDSQQYRGFALGLGIDRLTLLRYSIADLRALFENDLRFLQQF